jgi:hypothetical protein
VILKNLKQWVALCGNILASVNTGKIGRIYYEI